LSDQPLCPKFQDYGLAGQVWNSSSYEMSRIFLHRQPIRQAGAWQMRLDKLY